VIIVIIMAFSASTAKLLAGVSVVIVIFVVIMALIYDNHFTVKKCSDESEQCINACFGNPFVELNDTVDSASVNNSLVACLNQCPNVDSCKLSDWIRFYQEPSEDKATAELKYKEAMDLMDRYMEKENVSFPRDLDDVHYQLFVKELGSAVDEFADDEREKIDRFVEFIDLYENVAINRKIRWYQEKMEEDPNSLSEEELEDLYDLMPDDPSSEIVDSADAFSETKSSFQLMSGNGYNPIKARDYAWKWAHDRNPNYKSHMFDCTNFVSQALVAGGMRQYRKDVWGRDYKYIGNWYYSSPWLIDPSSLTWRVAHDFYRYWKDRTRRVEVTKESAPLVVGDVVSADWKPDGEKDHLAIVTKVEKGKVYLTYHTKDKKDEPLSNWWKNHPKARIYGFKMSEAKNKF
jgi:hypothetical protein